jgi:hypothetical protein
MKLSLLILYTFSSQSRISSSALNIVAFLLEHIPHVVSVSANENVVGVDASSIVAMVTGEHSLVWILLQ